MRRTGVCKWAPPDLPSWYDKIPKAVLFVIARQLAAVWAGCADDLGEGEKGILAEWTAQHNAGNVPQRPVEPQRED